MSFQVIQLEEVLAPPPPPPMKVNYIDLDIAEPLNPSPVVVCPPQTHEPGTDYAVIDFVATSAAARAGQDHVRRREDWRPSLSRTGSVAVAATQQRGRRVLSWLVQSSPPAWYLFALQLSLCRLASNVSVTISLVHG